VQLLLEGGASFDGASDELSNPMLAAVKNGHTVIADLLVQKGFRFTSQQQLEDTLRLASFKGDVDTVRLFLDGKAGRFDLEVPAEPLQVALYNDEKRKAHGILRDYPNINEQKGYFGNALQVRVIHLISSQLPPETVYISV
jgi:hypothetical protein